MAISPRQEHPVGSLVLQIIAQGRPLYKRGNSKNGLLSIDHHAQLAVRIRAHVGRKPGSAAAVCTRELVILDDVPAEAVVHLIVVLLGPRFPGIPGEDVAFIGEHGNRFLLYPV